LTAGIASLLLNLLVLGVLALLAGPRVNQLLEPWTGDSRWLRLIALAFVYASCLELVSLPFAFWSGYVLEHRYQLSNQTWPRWLWRKVKGYLVGGPLGLLLLLGLYFLLWHGGPWWWLWAAPPGWG